jgi:hypothetical protein
MSKNRRYEKASPQTQEEAMKAAKATQRPGQTKEQTKLIAQGIEKGINHYKKQQKEKSRQLNKKLHKVDQQLSAPDKKNDDGIHENTIYKLSFLPWVLLILSWMGVGAYFVFIHLL